MTNTTEIPGDDAPPMVRRTVAFEMMSQHLECYANSIVGDDAVRGIADLAKSYAVSAAKAAAQGHSRPHYDTAATREALHRMFPADSLHVWLRPEAETLEQRILDCCELSLAEDIYAALDRVRERVKRAMDNGGVL